MSVVECDDGNTSLVECDDGKTSLVECDDGNKENQDPKDLSGTVAAEVSTPSKLNTHKSTMEHNGPCSSQEVSKKSSTPPGNDNKKGFSSKFCDKAGPSNSNDPELLHNDTCIRKYKKKRRIEVVIAEYNARKRVECFLSIGHLPEK